MPVRKASNLAATTQIAGGGGGGAAAGGAESNPWATPTSPHSADDEFDGADMSAWSVQNMTDSTVGSISLNTVDPYDTTFNSGDAVRVSLDQRPSWAMIQSPANSDIYFIWKSITVPTNLLVVIRFKITASINVANDDCVCGLVLGELSTGVPVDTSTIRNTGSAPYQGQNRAVMNYHNPSGGTEGMVVDGYLTDALPYTHEFLAIQKLGTTYHWWLGTGQGAWTWYRNQLSVPFTPDYVAIAVKNNSTLSPGVSVVAVDYVRFYETDKFIL